MNTYELKVPGEIAETVRRDMKASLCSREQRIVADLHQIAVNAFDQNETSDIFWTDGIKKALTRFAEEQGLLCCHSGTTGEWLFDVSWVETRDSAALPDAWQSAQRLKLACESEWSEDEEKILWDFMKLSWVQADLRLFIYTNHMGRGRTTHPVALCKARCPPTENSRYLLIGFPKRAGETFRVDSWTTQPG